MALDTLNSALEEGDDVAAVLGGANLVDDATDDAAGTKDGRGQGRNGQSGDGEDAGDLHGE